MAKNGGLGFHLLNPHGPGGGVSCRLAGKKKGAVWTPRVQGGGFRLELDPVGAQKKARTWLGCHFSAKLPPPHLECYVNCVNCQNSLSRHFAVKTFKWFPPPKTCSLEFHQMPIRSNNRSSAVNPPRPSMTQIDPAVHLAKNGHFFLCGSNLPFF